MLQNPHRDKGKKNFDPQKSGRLGNPGVDKQGLGKKDSHWLVSVFAVNEEGDIPFGKRVEGGQNKLVAWSWRHETACMRLTRGSRRRRAG